jgi:hypothetical protein
VAYLDFQSHLKIFSFFFLKRFLALINFWARLIVSYGEPKIHKNLKGTRYILAQNLFLKTSRRRGGRTIIFPNTQIKPTPTPKSHFGLKPAKT